ncbi:13337_t:CDS:2, partial [Racocetra persica]
LYEKISNQRADNSYKLVNHFLNNYDLMAVEKLEIKKMIEFGKRVVEVNPKNTSKRCFGCGEIKQGLELKNRIFVCACGYEADRDINAAKNILCKAQTTEQELSSLDENMTSVSSLEPQRGSSHLQIQKD